MPISTELIAELKHESGNTRKILERVPAEKYLWKAHPKSMTLGRIAQHIAGLPLWVSSIMKKGEIDFAGEYIHTPEFTTHNQLMDYFEKNLSDAIEALFLATNVVFSNTLTLKRGDQIIFTMTKNSALRNMVMNHLIHHRGQLSVFLRLLDVPLPAMYGPTADERPAIKPEKNI